MMEKRNYTEVEIKEIMRDNTTSDYSVIGKFRLKNQGGFVVKMDFVYFDQQMEKKRVDGSRKSITLGCSETCDPGEYEVPEGAIVSIHADVVAGKDKEGASWFRYKKGAPATANFVISGTTLDNELGFIGLTEEE